MTICALHVELCILKVMKVSMANWRVIFYLVTNFLNWQHTCKDKLEADANITITFSCQQFTTILDSVKSTVSTWATAHTAERYVHYLFLMTRLHGTAWCGTFIWIFMHSWCECGFVQLSFVYSKAPGVWSYKICQIFNLLTTAGKKRGKIYLSFHCDTFVDSNWARQHAIWTEKGCGGGERGPS